MSIQKFYLGTYTKRESKGIYSVELDTLNKKLQNLKLEVSVDNPTYIDYNNDEFYSVTNNGIALSKNNNIVNSITLEKSTPCYVGYNKEENLIFSANYHTGEVKLFTNKDNELYLLDNVSYTKENVEKVHAHYANFTPDKNFVATCYLGTDEVVLYKIKNNKLIKHSTYKSKDGSGSRHIKFHPTKNIAYLICELDATLEVLNYDSDKGEFSLIQKVSILENQNQKKWASAIKILSNGKFLYTSNRGDDIITVFAIKENGEVEKIQTISTYGSVARDFNFDKSEQFLLVGHQESDNLTLFEIDNNGKLNLLEKDFFAPEVVCVRN